MRSFFKKQSEIALDRMFETRSEAWAAAGLQIEVNLQVARSAGRRLVLWVPLLVATVVGRDAALRQIAELAIPSKHHPHGQQWVVGKTPVVIAAVLLVLILGWLISRDLARIFPLFFRRMDPATAGTVEFVIRFVLVAATILGAFAVAGVTPQALAVGGAFTAVGLGLAAQQTLGDLFAGMVLLSARPFRLGERVRFQAGILGGQIEGVVASLGLLYTTLARGSDRFMIPNTVVLTSVVMPLREPEPVDVRVRLAPGVLPSRVQELLDANISMPTRQAPHVILEEIDGNEAIVRIHAIPDRPGDAARLADELIVALVGITGEHTPAKS